jgi:hypothetical protein
MKRQLLEHSKDDDNRNKYHNCIQNLPSITKLTANINVGRL